MEFKKYVEVWGSGMPMREFLWSEDLAEACVFILNNVQFKDVLIIQLMKFEIHISILVQEKMYQLKIWQT